MNESRLQGANMKLTITQIALGTLIALTTAFVIAWDPTTFHIRIPLPGDGAFQIIFNPDLKEVVASCLSILVLLLGLAVLGFSIARLVEQTREQPSEKSLKLAITQIALGALITVAALLVVFWGFPTSYFYQLPGGERQGIFFNPEREFVMAQQLTGLQFLLGLAVLGCSIVQFLKVRGSKIF